MYLILMQGVIAIVLAFLVWTSRADRQAMLVYACALLVPVGWAYATWSAWQRDEAARREGRFDRAFARKEQQRGYAIMAVSLVAAVALAMLVVVLV